MQNAPSVSYPVGRFWVERHGIDAAAVLLVLLCLAWWIGGLQREHSQILRDVALGALALGAVLIWWCLARRLEAATPEGELAWTAQDGRAVWECLVPGQPVCVVEPEIRLALPGALWLVLRGTDQCRRFVWAVRGRDPSQWLPLRRALWR